jgi:adenine-specific DNA-methyltransferase
MSSNSDDGVQEYRHDDKRSNNPPAGLASHVDDDSDKLHYRFDPHLPPKLRFDQTGKADELPDELPELLQKAIEDGLTEEEAETIATALYKRQYPWLEWTGKRQKHDVEVNPTALHTHERVSARAIIKALEREDVQRDLFADPQLPYHEAVQFYEHDVDWTNRLILGDSLEVMSSLAHRENLAGQVQMIYVDPPYGINYSSNFQPKVTSRSVSERYSDLTREPEMVKAYRDTWKHGIHSYLDYLRDRLVLCRELLDDSGSIFVQISDKNVHLLRNLLDEVFGRDCFVVTFAVKKKGSQKGNLIDSVNDYVLWYGKSPRGGGDIKYRPLFSERGLGADVIGEFTQVELPDGREYPLHSVPDPDGNIRDYRVNPKQLFKDHEGAKLFRSNPLTSGGHRRNQSLPFEHMGREFHPGSGKCWKTTVRTDDDTTPGMERLAMAERLIPGDKRWSYKRYKKDFDYQVMTNWWDGLGGTADLYVVETNPEIVKRCMLMTTDPGDLVLDPTCGSGTTANVAEKWGRRWITIDTSRVAISLARQRLLTSTYDFFEVKDDGASNDPGKGFDYETAPHIMLKDIANNPAVDKIHQKYQSTLDEKLAALNEVLQETVDDALRKKLKAKLENKRKEHNRYAITEADERRWLLPEDGKTWEHWDVPFVADQDYPNELKVALQEYRDVWQSRKQEMESAIAEGSEQEILYDQPKKKKGVTRVSGPFTVEAVMPPEESLNDSPISGTPDSLESGFESNGSDHDAENADSHLDKMTDLMREDGVRFMDNEEVEFKRLNRTEGFTYLHAEGVWRAGNGEEQVAVSFGPEHGPVTGRQVERAMREAYPRGYDAVIFAGFSFDDTAQMAIQRDDGEVKFHMAHIRPDVIMDDLLYSPSKEQIFTVFGLPRTTLRETDDGKYEIEMEGVDVYNPVKGQIYATKAEKVAAWFVDTDFDERTFCISQAFFPKKKTWKDLQRALQSKINTEQFDKLTGTTSLPFQAGENERVAVKVIDPRGNEVMRVHELD